MSALSVQFRKSVICWYMVGGREGITWYNDVMIHPQDSVTVNTLTEHHALDEHDRTQHDRTENDRTEQSMT